MTSPNPSLHLHTAPFLEREITTPGFMYDVILALFPVTMAAIWFFGLSALLILLTTTLGAMLTEQVFTTQKGTWRDGSAALTGLILGLTLPPTIPLWVAFIGTVVSIGLGKAVWGGLGHNLFNPALVGRAFLQAAFPTLMTTWCAPIKAGGFWALQPGTLAFPLMKAKVDVMSTATPLAFMKFERKATELWPLFSGNTAGSLGETSAGLILLGGLYLLIRRSFDWRIPCSLLLTVILLSTGFYLLGPVLSKSASYPTPWFMLLSGGLLFGAFFMATDPVTSPVTSKGTLLFGFGIGLLIVLIRLFGGLPEGVMYSILLMNAAAPLLERYTQPRPFGRGKGR